MVLFDISRLCWVCMFFSRQSWMKCYAPWYVSYFHGKQDLCQCNCTLVVTMENWTFSDCSHDMVSYMFHWLWCILLPSLKWLYTPKGLISMILVHLWTGKCMVNFLLSACSVLSESGNMTMASSLAWRHKPCSLVPLRYYIMVVTTSNTSSLGWIWIS